MKFVTHRNLVVECDNNNDRASDGQNDRRVAMEIDSRVDDPCKDPKIQNEFFLKFMTSSCVERVTCASRGSESPREQRAIVDLLRVRGIAGDYRDGVVSISGCV